MRSCKVVLDVGEPCLDRNSSIQRSIWRHRDTFSVLNEHIVSAQQCSICKQQGSWVILWSSWRKYKELTKKTTLILSCILIAWSWAEVIACNGVLGILKWEVRCELGESKTCLIMSKSKIRYLQQGSKFQDIPGGRRRVNLLWVISWWLMVTAYPWKRRAVRNAQLGERELVLTRLMSRGHVPLERIATHGNTLFSPARS